jgi:hypothetical protein
LKARKDHFVFSYSSDWTPTAQTFEMAKFIEKDSLFFASKTKLTTTKPFYALKVTLRGNYTYKKDVYLKLDRYLSSIKHQRSDLGFVVEKQVKTAFDNLPENEWLTEFYFPVKALIEPKAVPNPSNRPKTQEKRTIVPEQSKPREPIAPVERVVIPVESAQPIEPPKENNSENN